jgi:hypothetical protein
MSFAWNYFTRRFVGMNYRDVSAIAVIFSFGGSKFIEYNAKKDDNDFILQRVYTHDESDIRFREFTNKTDGAVKREHCMSYRKKIENLRAVKEREMALDAFNYLNKKELQL